MLTGPMCVTVTPKCSTSFGFLMIGLGKLTYSLPVFSTALNGVIDIKVTALIGRVDVAVSTLIGIIDVVSALLYRNVGILGVYGNRHT